MADGASDPRPASSKRLIYVDVLRAVAILTVVVHHLPDGFGLVFGRLQEWGGRGVDLFFVLSGFLIGSTCLQRAEVGANEWKQAKAYWLLRMARIWPPYFILLGGFALGVPFLDPAVRATVRAHPLPYVLFFSNDLMQNTLELGVLWSLAIEEQFYLAVGLLVLLCSRRRTTLGAAFLGVALGAVAVAIRYRYDVVVLYRDHTLSTIQYIPRLFFSTLSRLDQLALGLASAVAAPAFNRWWSARGTVASRLSAWSGIALCLALLVFLPFWPVAGYPLLGACFAACLLWVQRPVIRPGAAVGIEPTFLRILANVGKLSYGLYLLHPVTRSWMVLLFASLGISMNPRSAVGFLAFWTVGTWVLAAISYRFLEEPLLVRARRTARRILGEVPM